jgi:hypothetical protein
MFNHHTHHYHSQEGFIPYPALTNFCWSPSGALMIIRNPRYFEMKIDPSDRYREIYSIEQLNNYMTDCERKIRSENKLNILPNKEFLIEDNEEENDFCVEFEKNFALEADDNDDITDYLNFQIKKKATEEKKKEQESKEEEVKEEENFGDYLVVSLENPEFQKRMTGLLDNLYSTQALK